MRKCGWLFVLMMGVAVSPSRAGSGVEEGDIWLFGKIVSVDVAGMSFSVNCDSFVTAHGQASIEPPKRKVVTVSPQTAFYSFRPPQGKERNGERRELKFADLRPGEGVNFSGKDTGAGNPMLAREVMVTEPSLHPQGSDGRSRPAEPPGTPSGQPTASPASPAAPAQHTPTEAPTAPREGSGLPLPLLGGAGAALLLVAGGVIYALRFRKRR
jgi:hypothetical protein